MDNSTCRYTAQGSMECPSAPTTGAKVAKATEGFLNLFMPTQKTKERMTDLPASGKYAAVPPGMMGVFPPAPVALPGMPTSAVEAFGPRKNIRGKY